MIKRIFHHLRHDGLALVPDLAFSTAVGWKNSNKAVLGLNRYRICCHVGQMHMSVLLIAVKADRTPITLVIIHALLVSHFILVIFAHITQPFCEHFGPLVLGLNDQTSTILAAANVLAPCWHRAVILLLS